MNFDDKFPNEMPMLFETRIFGGKHDGVQFRYSTWKQAEEGHYVACNLAKGPQSARFE